MPEENTHDQRNFGAVGSTGRTDRRAERQREKITKLGDTPKMCEVYRLDPAYRRLVVDQHLVFYRVNDENKIVEIHRVLRGAWNLPQYLE